MKSSFLTHTVKAVWSFAAAAVLLTAGCGPKSASAPANSATPAGKKIHLVFIPKGMQHVYWKSVESGLRAAEKEARDAGTDVTVDWNGPANESERAAQIALVENYIGQKINGIILSPMDSDALVAPVQKAVQAGIPIVVVDSALNYGQIESFIATDNQKAGNLAGEELAKELGGKGNVLMMRFMPGSASTNYREDGFLETMKKYPNIKVLSSEVYGGDTADKCMKTAQDLLNSFKAQSVDGVFTPNEPSTNGMLLALKGAGLTGKIKFVGFDGGQQNMEGLNAGDINALVLQDPYKMGYLGVKTMLDFLAGKPVEKRIDTGTVLLTKDNQNDPKVKELLAHTVQ